MSKFNIQTLLDGFLKTIYRFPFVVGLAMLGTFTAMYIVEYPPLDKNHFFKIIYIALSGVAFVFSAALMGERKILPLSSLVLQAIAAALLALYFYLIPSVSNYITGYWIYQMFAIFIATHLLSSFAPYIGKNVSNGFWQYNKSLFINILTAFLYSGVLCLGIFLALNSLNWLFNVKIDFKTYWHIFFFLIGTFNTVFFLSKVPKNFDELETSDDYPIGLKLFSQYVLLPLVVIYLLILLAYEAKIATTFTLPKGYVSYLIIGFSVVGILCFLLLYPFSKLENNSWISKFNRWFYIIIVPLLGLLFIAIGYRISAYGLTEKRCVILLLGLWLFGVAMYFILSKKDNIAIIPISLAIVTILSSFGFWSSYSLSLRSQKYVLSSLLEKNNLVVKDSFNGDFPKITKKEAIQINSSLEFILERGEHQILKPLFVGLEDSLRNNKFDYTRAIGIRNYSYWDNSDYNDEMDSLATEEKEVISVHFQRENNESNTNVINVMDYTYLIDNQQFNLFEGNPYVQLGKVNNKLINLRLESKELIVQYGEDYYHLDLMTFFNSEKAKKELDSDIENNYFNVNYSNQDEFSLIAVGKKADIKFVFNSINFQVENKNHSVISLNGNLLIKEK